MKIQKLIVMCFDTNDGDYIYRIEDNKSKEWVDTLIRIWKQIKIKSNGERINQITNDKYIITHFESYDSKIKIKLSEEDTLFFTEILPNGDSECGVTLENIEIYDYTNHKKL